MRRNRLLALLFLLVLCGCPVVKEPVDPEPEPSPITVDSLKVVIIHETSEQHNLTRKQESVMFSTSMRADIKGAGGEFRLLDKDACVSRSDQWVRDVMDLDRESLPWLVVASPKGAWIGPMPDTTESVMKHVGELK